MATRDGVLAVGANAQKSSLNTPAISKETVVEGKRHFAAAHGLCVLRLKMRQQVAVAYVNFRFHLFRAQRKIESDKCMHMSSERKIVWVSECNDRQGERERVCRG